MVARRSVAPAPPDLRRHLADKMRHLIEDYRSVNAATGPWGRELERIEACEDLTFYGYQCRGTGAPVEWRKRYRLTTSDEIVPDGPGSFG